MSARGGRWSSALLLAAVMLAVWLVPAGCGGNKPVTQEEALEMIRTAYLSMAESDSYHYRSEVKYEFPDMDEAQKTQAAAMIPSYLSLEGEVKQGEGGYRQHARSEGAGKQVELYVVDGVSYKYTEETGWLWTDVDTRSLNLSDLYNFSSEDFENMLGFVGEIKVVEDSPEKLIVSFNAGSDYLLSSLQKRRDLYQGEQEQVVYDMLYQIMSNSSTEVTSHIYRDNGYLQRQETTMRLPDTPFLGTVVMSFKSDFFDYGADIQIQLSEEASKAKPAPTI